ncbi:MAG: hypothetical protein WCJ02_06225 [bacterium]
MSEALKEISLILDVWDDIFSDFDPRPLDERAVSEDFINELKKRYLETPKGALLISFYAPKSLKDDQSEQMVIRRLRKHFRDKTLQAKRDIYRMRARGAVFVFVGMLSLISITLISYFNLVKDLAIRLLEILFVPLGWFGIWEGFSKIINASPLLVNEHELYHKLSNAEYQFHYEP